MEQSNFMRLGLRDFLRGLIMAGLSPVFATVYNSFSHGEFTLNWHLVLASAVGGSAAYLSKNLFTKKDSK